MADLSLEIRHDGTVIAQTTREKLDELSCQHRIEIKWTDEPGPYKASGGTRGDLVKYMPHDRYDYSLFKNMFLIDGGLDTHELNDVLEDHTDRNLESILRN